MHTILFLVLLEKLTENAKTATYHVLPKTIKTVKEGDHAWTLLITSSQFFAFQITSTSNIWIHHGKASLENVLKIVR